MRPYLLIGLAVACVLVLLAALPRRSPRPQTVVRENGDVIVFPIGKRDPPIIKRADGTKWLYGAPGATLSREGSRTIRATFSNGYEVLFSGDAIVIYAGYVLLGSELAPKLFEKPLADELYVSPDHAGRHPSFGPLIGERVELATPNAPPPIEKYGLPAGVSQECRAYE